MWHIYIYVGTEYGTIFATMWVLIFSHILASGQEGAKERGIHIIYFSWGASWSDKLSFPTA